uniref:Uncharacterized protein n=1 Tax=Romanomermis culicivorax TaxID=13658 RepID=A0A915IE88_ROMCU
MPGPQIQQPRGHYDAGRSPFQNGNDLNAENHQVDQKSPTETQCPQELRQSCRAAAQYAMEQCCIKGDNEDGTGLIEPRMENE